MCISWLCLKWFILTDRCFVLLVSSLLLVVVVVAVVAVVVVVVMYPYIYREALAWNGSTVGGQTGPTGLCSHGGSCLKDNKNKENKERYEQK